MKLYHPPNGYCDHIVKRKPPKKVGTCGSNSYHFHNGESLCTKHFKMKDANVLYVEDLK